MIFQTHNVWGPCMSGWWFGTCFMTFHIFSIYWDILGMDKSSQLTFTPSFFRGLGQPGQPPSRWWCPGPLGPAVRLEDLQDSSHEAHAQRVRDFYATMLGELSELRRCRWREWNWITTTSHVRRYSFDGSSPKHCETGLFGASLGEQQIGSIRFHSYIVWTRWTPLLECPFVPLRKVHVESLATAIRESFFGKVRNFCYIAIILYPWKDK